MRLKNSKRRTFSRRSSKVFAAEKKKKKSNSRTSLRYSVLVEILSTLDQASFDGDFFFFRNENNNLLAH